MSNEQKLMDAQTELQEVVKRYEQAEHRYARAQNRENYLKGSKRRERNHRLITRGVAVENMFKGLDGLFESEFYELMESVFQIPTVQYMTEEKIAEHNRKEENS